MFKLVSLLAAGMFLTLLIGGEDNGQTRQGLMGVTIDPAARPVVREAKVAPKVEKKPDVTLANFTPVVVQAPVAPRGGSTIAGDFVKSDTATAEPVAVVAAAEPTRTAPIMYVSGRSVNVRQGPSTDYEVVGQLTRAEAVTVISVEEEGWVRIAIEGDGLEGYIAARLLTETNPAGN